mmetsp:Transcript_20791/g.48590  ORF Transcript_20791/g.48590 Transcript_20791/m.48590 type:complete len:90 (+) Transcript_20791:879-1148(+)
MVFKYGCGRDEGTTEAFEATLFANANRGGENVATGALMGALMGASVGFSRLPPALVAGLTQREAIDREVEAFLMASPFAKKMGGTACSA